MNQTNNIFLFNIFANTFAVSSISSQDVALRGSHRDFLSVIAVTVYAFTIPHYFIPCGAHGLAPDHCPFKRRTCGDVSNRRTDVMRCTRVYT